MRTVELVSAKSASPCRDRSRPTPGVDELRARLLGTEAAREHGRDGNLVGDERGRVFDQRFALDDRHEPPGTPSRPAIAVAATGSVGETMAPSTNAVGHDMLVDHRVGDDRDGARGGEHEPDREQADRADVLAQLAQPVKNDVA
jgi:hypothetical protein